MKIPVLPILAASVLLFCAAKPVTDLSSGGTANCYIISSSGNFRFNASVKGNGNESVGDIASAEVLWESFGTDKAPSSGEIIGNVSFEGGFISFSAPDPLINGNALIAGRDAAGTILWSWHIWVCKGFRPASTAQTYRNGAGTMMDRNLGATSAIPGDTRSLGLLYQWGRKDPFLGCGSASNESLQDQTMAASTLENWPEAVKSAPGKGTVEYAVAHPTTFILRNDTDFDWLYRNGEEQDNTRWTSGKSIYDPCPAGWRVPDGGKDGVWAKAWASSQYIGDGPLDTEHRGFNFGKSAGERRFGDGAMIWYPTPGFRSLNDGSVRFAGFDGYCWSCTTCASDAYYLAYHYDAYVYPISDYGRAMGLSVRCVRQ